MGEFFSSIDYKAILTSEAAIVFYIAAVLYGYTILRVRLGWDADRIEGMVSAAFLAAESSGLKTGNQKLDFALQVFAKEFRETNGADPDATDLKDAALDLARKAFEYKFAPKA